MSRRCEWLQWLAWLRKEHRISASRPLEYLIIGLYTPIMHIELLNNATALSVLVLTCIQACI